MLVKVLYVLTYNGHIVSKYSCGDLKNSHLLVIWIFFYAEHN